MEITIVCLLVSSIVHSICIVKITRQNKNMRARSDFAERAVMEITLLKNKNELLEKQLRQHERWHEGMEYHFRELTKSVNERLQRNGLQ